MQRNQTKTTQHKAQSTKPKAQSTKSRSKKSPILDPAYDPAQGAKSDNHTTNSREIHIRQGIELVKPRPSITWTMVTTETAPWGHPLFRARVCMPPSHPRSLPSAPIAANCTVETCGRVRGPKQGHKSQRGQSTGSRRETPTHTDADTDTQTHLSSCLR